MAQVLTPAETVGANFYEYEQIKVFSIEVTKMDAVDACLSNGTVIPSIYNRSWYEIKYHLCHNEITNCFEDVIIKKLKREWSDEVSQEDLPLLRALIAAQKKQDGYKYT